MDMNKVIAQIIWTVEDVAAAFKRKHGRQPNEKELEECIGNINLKTLNDRSIEYGWDFIDQAV